MIKEITAKDLQPGDKIKVLTVNSVNKQYLRKLAVFGVLPGTEMKVLQTRPVYVFCIGNTELALDSDIVQKITFIR